MLCNYLYLPYVHVNFASLKETCKNSLHLVKFKIDFVLRFV